MMTVDESLNIAVIHALSIKHGIAVSEAAEAASILAAEVRRLRSEIDSAREDLQSFIEDRNHWKTKTEAAEAVLHEWRDVITELADDLSIELDMRYQSRSHYPSELRKYENEMHPVYRARSLLQSTGDKK